MKICKLSLFLCLTLLTNMVSGQTKEHMLGVKSAFNLSSLYISNGNEIQPVKTSKNFSLVYTYYHDIWKDIPNAGFQAALSYEEQGYQLNGQRYDYTLVKMPLTSQFHIDFWKMRLLLNLGCFAGYRLKSVNGFAEDDYRFDYGFLAGGGLGFMLKPFEIHLETNYHHSLSYMFNTRRYSQTDLVYANPYQVLLSLALYVHL